MLPLLNATTILDFTTIVLGPYATQTLADLGADVIKVESLQGDLFRSARPGRSRAMGAGFINFNRNKRSLSLDLKHPAARDVLDRLVRRADALVHNMRPSSAATLGLDYARLAALHPRLVYAFAAGYDQRGPNAEEPAYDDVIQAASGVAALNANERGEPRYLATILCDKVAGLHLAVAVAAAIARRERTGLGCCIEAPMFESVVSFLMTEQLGGESFVPPLGATGYGRLNSPYRRPYRTRDGFLAIMPYTTTHWTQFFELIGRHEQAHSPLIQDPTERSHNVDTLYAIVAEVAPSRTCAEWLAALRERDIPCSPVNSIDDLLHDPHLQATGFFREYDHPTEGRMRAARSPFHLHDVAEEPDQPAPCIGADTRSILESVGYTTEEIERLAAARVIGVGDQEP